MTYFLRLLTAVALTVIGLIGLVVPIIPGFVLLLIALVIFASLSPRLRHRLNTHPRLRRLFARLDAGSHLHALDRMRLTVWACLEAVTGTRKM